MTARKGRFTRGHGNARRRAKPAEGMHHWGPGYRFVSARAWRGDVLVTFHNPRAQYKWVIARYHNGKIVGAIETKSRAYSNRVMKMGTDKL